MVGFSDRWKTMKRPSGEACGNSLAAPGPSKVSGTTCTETEDGATGCLYVTTTTTSPRMMRGISAATPWRRADVAARVRRVRMSLVLHFAGRADQAYAVHARHGHQRMHEIVAVGLIDAAHVVDELGMAVNIVHVEQHELAGPPVENGRILLPGSVGPLHDEP